MLAMKMHSEGSPETSNPKLNSWNARLLWFEPVTFRWIRGKHLTTKARRPSTLIYNDKIIIDDGLLYSNHVPSLLHYFSCVIQLFTKYRLSFKLTKCDFFKPRVEFVGHDLTTYGNCPTESKFDLIQHWPLLPNAIYFLSFIGLCGLYSRYYP